DIKCRKAGLKPDCAVVVATIRALKMHGGVAKDALKAENTAALEKGFANLERHIKNIRSFGVPPVVSVNRFSADTEAEMALIKKLCAGLEVECIIADHWAQGGEGAVDVARAVVKPVESTPSRFQPLYPDDMPLWNKVETIATKLYGAAGISGDQSVRNRFKELQDQGFGHLPVCIAKTQYSFST